MTMDQNTGNEMRRTLPVLEGWGAAGESERVIARLIYGVVLFAFFYFGMGTFIFLFFR